MEKDTIKYKGFFERTWNDPVWSKVISAGIIAVLTILYSIGLSIFKEISFKEAILNILNFQIKIYVYFIISISAILIYYLIYRIRKYKNNKIVGFDIEKKVGNFSFRELYNALLTHKITTPINLMGPGIPKETDLLSLFVLYMRIFNQGVEWEHDYDTYYLLGPILMSYELVEKVPTPNKLDTLGLEVIQTSKVGYEFYAMLEKWRVYNEKFADENLEKLRTPKPEKK